ncbi:MAG: undecaprenyl-diphosphate phosphatase [Syntrophomonadaceae bacterium]|nr:undecaprenyl-diphosphate phosphatase [Syntrophomonadaceae bacterium]
MEFIEILKVILVGIVQGITEWLPISSTGHMILLDEFVTLDMGKNFMEVFWTVIQLGSIMAVVVLFFNRLNPFARSKTAREKSDTWTLWFKVAVGVLPAAVIGLLFEEIIYETFFNPQVVATALIVYGVLFIVLENRNKPPVIEDFNQLSYKTALFIGMFQVLSMIPGTSRSGSTILGAIFLGSSRYVASEFSFFMAIPVMLGASGLKLVKSGFAFSTAEWMVLAIGSVTAFLVSIWAIKFLLSYIKTHDFKVFGYYRIVLGLLVLCYFFFIL